MSETVDGKCLQCDQLLTSSHHCTSMSEINERYGKMAREIVEALGGQFHCKCTPCADQRRATVAAKLRELLSPQPPQEERRTNGVHGDWKAVRRLYKKMKSTPPTAIEILKMSKEQRDRILRESAEAMKDVDVESFDDYREIGVAWTERTQELCDKMKSTPPTAIEILKMSKEQRDAVMRRSAETRTDDREDLWSPPPELEDAVTDALLEIGVASKPNCKVLVDAVTPLLDNLKKQIEYQREIHQSNDAAFEKINNEALTKIETLEQRADKFEKYVAYAAYAGVEAKSGDIPVSFVVWMKQFEEAIDE